MSSIAPTKGNANRSSKPFENTFTSTYQAYDATSPSGSPTLKPSSPVSKTGNKKNINYASSKPQRGQAGGNNTTNNFSSSGNGSTNYHPARSLRYRTDFDKSVIHFMLNSLTGPKVEEVTYSSKYSRVSSSSSSDSDNNNNNNNKKKINNPPEVTDREGDFDKENTQYGDWHFFWMSVGRVRSIFSAADYRLQDHQIINHFPNHWELTRKDSMYKNIKRYIRDNTPPGGSLNTNIILPVEDTYFTAPRLPTARSKALADNTSQRLFNSSSSPSLLLKLINITPDNWQAAAIVGGGGLLRASDPGARVFCFADSVPITFNIPSEFRMLIEEVKRQPNSAWIAKPTNRSQGKGIFLMKKLSDILKWSKEKKEYDAALGIKGAAATTSASRGTHHDELAFGDYLQGTYIVSQYITNPLLIGKKKFDLRLYVLVTSYKPLVAYLHEKGFARFCATEYAGNEHLGEKDLGSHLTNVSLQKGEEDYNKSHGGKWLFSNLILYIQSRYGPYVAESLVQNIEFLIYHSLKSVESVIYNDEHSFELYGYDILIDDMIRPHLIEVNASPSLATTTLSDRFLKEEVLSDAIKIVLPPGFPDSRSIPYREYRTRTDLTTKLPTGFKLLKFA